MHGGLFSRDKVSLKDISQINRFADPPSGAAKDNKTFFYSFSLSFNLLPQLTSPLSPSEKERLFEEILWSDPVSTEGRSLTARGVGIGFGPDVTKVFRSFSIFLSLFSGHNYPFIKLFNNFTLINLNNIGLLKEKWTLSFNSIS